MKRTSPRFKSYTTTLLTTSDGRFFSPDNGWPRNVSKHASKKGVTGKMLVYLTKEDAKRRLPKKSWLTISKKGPRQGFRWGYPNAES